MTLAELYLPDFDQEMTNTRRVLERVPTDKFDYSPHGKSWKMGGLATHVANLPTWATLMIDNDSFDIAPPGQSPMRAPEQKSTACYAISSSTHLIHHRAQLTASMRLNDIPLPGLYGPGADEK